jgi:hypothetical protein
VSREKNVRWPGKAYDAAGEDLGGPIQQLLIDLHVLENEDDHKDMGPFTGTPFSIQVITAGATALAKVWPGLIALLGGGGAIAVGLEALGYGSDQPAQAAAFTLAAAILGSAVAISIAVIVKADVSARAMASAAQYHARSEVTGALLRSSQYNVPVPAVVPPALNYLVMTRDQQWYAVQGFRLTPNGVVVDLIGRDHPIPITEVAGITPSTVWDQVK